MTEFRSNIVIGLGGNLPFRDDPTATSLIRAVQLLSADDLVIRAVSRFFQTPCFPAGAGPDYVNAAISIETSMNPQLLLHRLHEVEFEFDRSRQQRWGMRTLDLDILFYGQLILPDRIVHQRWLDLPSKEQIQATPDQLILPHPRLQDRAFALVPVSDIVPDWVHPTLHKSVRKMCAALPPEEIQAVEPI